MSSRTKLLSRLRKNAQVAAEANDALHMMQKKRERDLYELEEKNKAAETYYKTHKRTASAKESSQNKLITEAYDRGIQRLEVALKAVRDAHDIGVDRLADALGKPTEAAEGEDFMSPTAAEAAKVTSLLRSLKLQSIKFGELSEDEQKLMLGHIHDTMTANPANVGLTPNEIKAKMKADYSWVDGRRTRPLSTKIANQIAFDTSRGATRAGTPPSPRGSAPGGAHSPAADVDT